MFLFNQLKRYNVRMPHNPFELDFRPLPRLVVDRLPPEAMLRELKQELENARAAAHEREQEIQKDFAHGPLLMGMEEQLKLVQLMAEDANLGALDDKIKKLSSQIRILEEPPVEQELSRTETIAAAAEPKPESTPAEPPAQSIQTKRAEIKTIEKTPRRSSVMRVVGKDLTEEDREDILDTMARRFEEQSFEGSEDYERPATEEEVHYMRWANEATNHLLRQYGLEPFDVPPKNIHVIRKEITRRRAVAGGHFITKGSFDPMYQAVAVCEAPRSAEFAAHLIHELIHLKSYGALMISEPDRDVIPYRVGLHMAERHEKATYFKPLNEAITEELTKHIFLNAEEPKLQHILQTTREFAAKNPDAINELGGPLFDEDTYDLEIVGKEERQTKVEVNKFSYAAERRYLWQLVDKLYSQNTESFPDREAVFTLFARAAINGNILPLGRLIEKTFGKGTFRKLAECYDRDEFKDLVDSLPSVLADENQPLKQAA